MTFQKLFLLCALLPSFVFGYPLTPDSDQTPGHLCGVSDRDFEEYRYDERIPYCHRNVSSATKRKIYQNYDIPQDERRDYTIDHLIPLSLGGSNSPNNLWPEHKEVKALRPSLELHLFIQLRDGKIRQKEAVEKIVEAKFHPYTEDDLYFAMH